MKHYGMDNPEGSDITNLTAPSGTSDPSDPNAAELYYRTDTNRLEVHNGTAWKELALVDDITGVAGSDPEIQFNDGGSLGADSEFTYVKASRRMIIGTTSSGTLRLGVGGAGKVESGSAQSLTVQPGSGSGQLSLWGATNSAGNGGQVVLAGGYSPNNVGGDVNIQGGSTGGANEAGSKIVLRSGFPNGLGANGYIQITQQGANVAGNPTPIRFYGYGGTNYVSLEAPDMTGSPAAVDRAWTLPQDNPSVVAGQFLTTDASGILSFDTPAGLANIVEDVTPQLGANLDVNGFDITDSVNGSFAITGHWNSGGAGNLLTITAGGSAAGAGGAAILAGAQGSTSGGGATIKGGLGSSTSGGDVALLAGNGATAGGDVRLQVGRDTADASADGSCSLEKPSGTTAPVFKFHEAGTNGTNYVALTAPDSITADRTWTLPEDDPSTAAGKFLTTDASGVLSFDTPGAGAFLPLIGGTLTGDLTIDTGAQIFLPDGSEANPAIAFTGNTGAGLYLTAGSNQMVMVQSGAEALRFTGTNVNFTDLIGINDGSAASPSLQFSNDDDCGLFRVTTNVWGLSVGGDEALRLRQVGSPLQVMLSVDGAGADSGYAAALSDENDIPNKKYVDDEIAAVGVSFPLLAPDGTAGAPSYSFSSGDDAGLYRVTTNTLGLSTAGQERITISSSAVTSSLSIAMNNNAQFLGDPDSDPAFALNGYPTTGWGDGGFAGARLKFTIGGSEVLRLRTTQINAYAPVRVQDGSVSAPTFAFTSNQASGLYSPLLNQLGFVTNSLERFIIDTDGTLAARTASYETLVTDDQDIPNKKYVDDTLVSSGTAVQLTEYTATAGQTVFSGADNNAVTLAYVVGQLYVYKNGVLLEDTVDYVATTGSTIVLNTGATLDDTIQATAFSTFTGSGASADDYIYTATEGQTTFTGTDDNAETLGYNPGDLLVYLNGALLINGTDYTATSGTSVVLTVGASAGNILQVYEWGSFLIGASSDILNQYVYTATASQTTFTGSDDNANTLAYSAGDQKVYLNGALLESGTDYTASNGTSIILTSPAALDDLLQVTAFGTFNVANHYTKGEVDNKYSKFSIQFLLPVGANDTYTMQQSAQFGFTIDKTYYQTSTGTITGDVKIGGVSVTGMSSLSFTSSEGNSTATDNRVVAEGDKVTLVTTSTSGATMASIILHCTRT